MAEHRLENLIVFVPGDGKDKSDLERARATSRIATEIAAEIKRAKEKLQGIETIDGKPVSITELKMTGKTCIEDIEIKYRSDGETGTRKYSKEEFYNL